MVLPPRWCWRASSVRARSGWCARPSPWDAARAWRPARSRGACARAPHARLRDGGPRLLLPRGILLLDGCWWKNQISMFTKFSISGSLYFSTDFAVWPNESILLIIFSFNVKLLTFGLTNHYIKFASAVLLWSGNVVKNKIVKRFVIIFDTTNPAFYHILPK